jgi:hypothetical protein
MNILEAVRTVFALWFKGDTWKRWIVFLSALFGLEMSAEQTAIFREHTGRSVLPVVAAREAWLVVGRRGGKSLIAALLATFLATFRDYSGFLAPGEVATVMVIAADRRQARVVMRYIRGFLENVPMLACMIVKQTAEAIELSNRVVIEVHTCSFRAVRGYSVGAAICDEVAFWRSDESANPDTEIIAALRPALATLPGSLLLCISSPYARRGALWQAYQKHFGKDSDPVLVWQGDTYSMNPSIDPSIIERAIEEDEASADAEYGAMFRRDIESYISKEAVDAVVEPGRRELAYSSEFRYVAFVDAAGGSGADSYTAAIAHKSKEGIAVLDAVREWKPPFSPEQATKEAAELMAAYRLTEGSGDRYAGDWPREQFAKHGITIKAAEKAKSDIYKELLGPLNSRKVELLDHPKLIAQLCGLERRTARGGKDSIDHSEKAHDDIINSAAGALVCAVSGFQRAKNDCGWS